MSIRNMEERILTVSSVCQTSRENSKYLLQNHGWTCDLAISAYTCFFTYIYRFYDGELERRIIDQKSIKENTPESFFTYFFYF